MELGKCAQIPIGQHVLFAGARWAVVFAERCVEGSDCFKINIALGEGHSSPSNFSNIQYETPCCFIPAHLYALTTIACKLGLWQFQGMSSILRSKAVW